jgi:hypothetical protein
MLIYIAEIDKYCGAASCAPRFNIACTVTDHKAFVQSTRAARRRGAACRALACDIHIHRSVSDSRPRTRRPARSSATAGAISSTTLRPNSTALHVGLVGDDDQSKNCSLHYDRRSGGLVAEAKVFEPPWRVSAPIAEPRHRHNAVAVDEHHPGRGVLAHIWCGGLQRRMGDEAMPNDRLYSLGERRHPFGCDRRNDDHDIIVAGS